MDADGGRGAPPAPPTLHRPTLLAGEAACPDFGAECDHSPLHRGWGRFLSTLQKGLQAENRDLKSTRTL